MPAARRLLPVTRGGGGFAPSPFVASGPYDPADGHSETVLTQIHCHTTASDGDYTPAEVVNDYLTAGYGALMISDHDLVTSQPAGITTAISGNELSPPGHHILSINSSYTRGATTDAQTIIDAIIAASGTPALAHPKWLAGFTQAAQLALNNYRAMEIHNAIVNSGAGQNPITYPGFAVDRWDAVLTGDRRDIWATSVDDFHWIDAFSTYDVGRLKVFVPANNSTNIMAAITAGNFVADVSNYGITPGYPIRSNLGVSLACAGATGMEAWGSAGLLDAVMGSSIAYVYDGTEDYVRLVAIGEYDEPFDTALNNRWQAISGTWNVASGMLSLAGDATPRMLILRRHREGDHQGYIDIRLNHVNAGFLLLFNVLLEDYYYGLRIGPNSGNANENNKLAVRKVNAGTLSNPANTAYTADIAEWQRIKWDITSSTGRIRAKVWEVDNDPEPGAWMIDTNDTTWKHGAYGFRATETPDIRHAYFNGFRTYYQPISVD